MSKYFKLNSILKGIAFISLVYIVFEISRTYPLYYPHPFFEYQTNYHHFTLFSDQPIKDYFLNLVDEAVDRVSPVEIYDPDNTYHVFVVHDTGLFGSFAEKLNMNPAGQALTIHPLGYILINLTAVERTKSIYKNRYPHTLYRGDTAYILSHELMHVLTTDRLGFFSSWLLPDWKREGYAEYGASLHNRRHDPNYSLFDRFKQYRNGFYDDLSENQQFYIRSGLLVEYLMDIEEIDFAGLMRMEISEDSAFARLQQWHRLNSR